MRKLTEHQIAVLAAMPKSERSRFWGRGPASLSISARTACLRKDLIRLTHRGTIWTFELTDAGRAALALKPEGRTDRA